ncbi:MAG TPA: energy transducer TonB [Longimicrobium sp.]|nr:energy transducer TonB [Longimicrobium sp.]
MDTLAPATLAFRRRATRERLVLDAGLEIGAGGEAVVYAVPGDSTLVAKIYRKPTVERARKLTRMLENPPRLPAGTDIAWPTDLLLGASGFAGFVMPRAEGPRLFEFYNPTSRRSAAPACHYGMLHRVGRNLAGAFDALHAAGYVVGDVNESNILVNPADGAVVTLVDADSFQVADPKTGAIFRSHVGKAEFTPPELQGIPFGQVDRGPEHDRFGLGVLLFLLLMEGTHPFAVRMESRGQPLAVEERIRRGLFSHTSDEDDVHPPRLSPPGDMLDPGLRALFVRCFADGHADPSARPSPAEWRNALQAAEAALVTCAKNRLHRHHPHLRACPWCQRAALLGGRDPFPAGAQAKRVKAPPRARQTPRAQPPRPAPVVPVRPRCPAPATVPAGPRPQAPARARHPRPTQPSHAAPAPSARATTPAPWQLALAPPPPLYGRLVTNPLVFMLAGLAAAIVGGGAITAGGLIVATVAAVVLLFRRKKLHADNVLLALIAAVLVGRAVLSALASIDTAAPPPVVEFDPQPRTGVGAPVADAEPAPQPQTGVGTPPADAKPAPRPRTGVGTPVAAAGLDATPELLNRAEVDSAVAAAYPPDLREAGGGTTITVGFTIDGEGRVMEGTFQFALHFHTQLAAAARSVVPLMRFTPPTVDGEPVEARIAIPITFAP